MKAREKMRAFALFLEGNTLRSISKKVRVHRSTIERWSKSGKWVQMRKDAWNKKTSVITKKYLSRSTEFNSTIKDELSGILIAAVGQFQAYISREIPKKALQFSSSDLVRLVNLLADK